MKSVKYSVKNSIIRGVIVCASTFKSSKQRTYRHKAVLLKLKISVIRCCLHLILAD